MKKKIESDNLGKVYVPKNLYFGPQTERGIEFLPKSREKIPREIIFAYAYIKKSCAYANYELGLISKYQRNAIIKVCSEILKNKLDKHFPLSIWQAAAGTNLNMNMNEVISNKANEILRKKNNKDNTIHPNDTVNLCQSTNDTFVSAINIATIISLEEKLIPFLEFFLTILRKKINQWKDIVKVSRTHLMDAVPIKLKDEFSSYYSQIKNAMKILNKLISSLLEIPLGGTAVGTGIGAHKKFGATAVKYLNKMLLKNFVISKNKFLAISSSDSLVNISSDLKLIATILFKMANDITILSSGPRAGIAEMILPETQQGSSIMPGKVNPLQCEAMKMIAMQVMANDLSISMCASQGNFSLNSYRPLMSYNLLQSIHLLSEGINCFAKKCIMNMKVNKKKIKEHLDNSLSIATVLNEHIGYDKASQAVRYARKKDISLKRALVILGYLSEDEFDSLISKHLLF